MQTAGGTHPVQLVPTGQRVRARSDYDSVWDSERRRGGLASRALLALVGVPRGGW